MRTLFSFVFFLMACAVHAADLPSFDVLRVGSKTYKGVKVTLQEPSGIRFTHEAGAARAKFEELEPEVRAKFTFDPKEAANFEADRERKQRMAALVSQEQKLNEQMAAQAKKEQIRIQGKVQSVTPQGVLLTDAEYFESEFQMRALPDDSAFLICSPEGLVNGSRIDEMVYPRGGYQFTTVLGASRKVKCFTLSLQDHLSWRLEPSKPPAPQ